MSSIGNTPYFFHCPLCKTDCNLDNTEAFLCTEDYQIVPTDCQKCYKRPRTMHYVKCCSKTICLPCKILY